MRPRVEIPIGISDGEGYGRISFKRDDREWAKGNVIVEIRPAGYTPTVPLEALQAALRELAGEQDPTS